MRWLIVLVMATGSAAADTLIAARMIRPQTLLSAADVALRPGPELADLTPDSVIGLEARVLIYPGRPIRPSDIGAPALIDRHQIVTLQYMAGPVSILAEGRAMGRAGAGEMLRVVNTTSRIAVTGLVQPDGTVLVTR